MKTATTITKDNSALGGYLMKKSRPFVELDSHSGFGHKVSYVRPRDEATIRYSRPQRNRPCWPDVINNDLPHKGVRSVQILRGENSPRKWLMIVITLLTSISPYFWGQKLCSHSPLTTVEQHNICPTWDDLLLMVQRGTEIEMVLLVCWGNKQSG